MNLHELFWNASENDRNNGYIILNTGCMCLLCGTVFEKGIIYENNGILYDVERYTAVHIEKEHGSVFDYIIGLDKKITGLSSHQCALLKLFYLNLSGHEIQKELAIGSASTIRQHRFALKEKERQAKIFLTLMQNLKEKESKNKSGNEHKIRNEKLEKLQLYTDRIKTLSDNSENEKIIKRYFPDSYGGRLKTFIMKEKCRLIILKHISSNFIPEKKYSAREIDSILSDIYDDYASIKRYLVDYKFMERTSDGRYYWLINENLNRKKEMKAGNNMKDKKEMKRLYKEMKKEGGVYQIKNTANGKILLLASSDLKTVNGKLMQLRSGSYLNEALQADWNLYGEAAFIVEVLESINQEDENFKSKLEKIEIKWFEKLNPYGERGYNVPGRRY